MGKLIHVRSVHEQVQRLLPWYANGTLDSDEETLVEDHLAACAQCREELAKDRVAELHIASLPTAGQPDWESLRRRVTGASRPARASMIPLGPIVRRRVSLGAALFAQAAAIVLMIGGVSLWQFGQPPRYHTLGASGAASQGNAIVAFRPETSELVMRTLLRRFDARLVNGPTAGDAYVLQLQPGQRDAMLKTLRADSHVILAQPID